MSIAPKKPVVGEAVSPGSVPEGQRAKPYVLSFTADVSPPTAQALLAAVASQLMQGFNDLHLLISTTGGRVADGLTIYNVLRALPINVTTYNVGTVSSIGNVVFLAGEKRYATKSSSFMFHGVGFDIERARFEEKDLNAKLAGLQNDQSLIADVITRHTKISKEQARELFLTAAFVPAAEAQRRGIVDEVRDIKFANEWPFLQLVFGK